MNILNSIASFFIGDKDKGKGMIFMVLGYSLIITLFCVIFLIFGYDINIWGALIFIAIITFVVIVLYIFSLIVSLWLSGKILGGHSSITEVGIVYIIIISLNTIIQVIFRFGSYLNTFYEGIIGILGIMFLIIGFISSILSLILWYYSIMELQDFGFFRTIFCFMIAGVFTYILTKVIIYIVSFMVLFLYASFGTIGLHTL